MTASPKAELLSAERARAVKARFDAAQTTNENRNHWAGADGLGPISSLDPRTRETTRNRARYEVGSDTYCNGMLSTVANDTVGTGPTLQMMTGSKEHDRVIETSFWKWTVAIDLARKLRTMRRTKAVDGEAFGSLFTNRQLRNPVRLDVRLLEAEMIASPVLGMSVNSLTDGIILDDFGNPTAYTVLKEHPGERLSGSLDYEYVPAKEMVHLFNADRPGQIRGISEITPALPLFAWRRRYSLAVLSAAENAAHISWMLKTQQSISDPANLEPLDAIEAERGMGMTLPAGWEMQQLKAEQPTAQFDMFTKAIIREIARCLNMPFNIAAGDSSEYNYASGRMDHQIYVKAQRVERSYIELAALDVLLREWWREARLVPGELPESLRVHQSPLPHGWRWDGYEHVDPKKEAEAQAIRLESNTTTLAEEWGKVNKDWEEQLRQRAKEKALMRELGLEAVESAATKPSPSPKASDEEEDDEDE